MLITENLQMNDLNEIMLNEIIFKLKRKNFNDIYDASVSYYHHGKQLYVFGFFIRRDITDDELLKPLSKRIPFEALESSSTNPAELNCKLRLRQRIKTKVDMLIQEQVDKFGEPSNDNDDHKKGTKQK